MPPVRPKVLNDVFQQAVDQAKQKLPTLTQNQQVNTELGGLCYTLRYDSNSVVMLYPGCPSIPQ